MAFSVFAPCHHPDLLVVRFAEFVEILVESSEQVPESFEQLHQALREPVAEHLNLDPHPAEGPVVLVAAAVAAYWDQVQLAAAVAVWEG